MTATTSLQLFEPATGTAQGTWGNLVNGNMMIIDAAIAGSASINLTGLSTYTLNNTVSSSAPYPVDATFSYLSFTGVTVASPTSVVLPLSIARTYAITNSTSNTLQIKTTSAAAKSIIIPVGVTQSVFCDGANVTNGLHPIVSLLDFPYIDNTGVVDSGVNIQLAINTGVDLFVPPGTYLSSISLTMATNGQKIYGSRSVIFKKSTNIDQIIITANDAQLIGLAFNGNNKTASGIGIKGQGNLIQGCEVYGQGTTGNTSCHGIYMDGQFTTCTQNIITENYIHNCMGIGLSSNTAPDNIRINNVVVSCAQEGGTIDGSGSGGAFRSIFSANRIIGCCTVSGVGGIGIDDGNNSVINDNVISGTLNNLPGIMFQNNVAATNYCTVSGNSLTSNTGGGIRLYNNISSTFKSLYNVISSNAFQGNTGFDIQVDAGCTGNIIMGNQANAVIIDNNAGGINGKTGVICNARAYLSTTASGVTGDGTVYTIPFDTAPINNGYSGGAALVPYSTSTFKFTAPINALYSASAACRVQSGTLGTYAQLQIVQKNAGGTVLQAAQAELDLLTISPLSTSFNLNVHDLFSMAATDYLIVTIAVFGNTAGTKPYAVNGASSTTFFNAVLAQ